MLLFLLYILVFTDCVIDYNRLAVKHFECMSCLSYSNNNDNNNEDRFSLFLSVNVKHISASVVAKHRQDDAQIESVLIIIIIIMYPSPQLQFHSPRLPVFDFLRMIFGENRRVKSHLSHSPILKVTYVQAGPSYLFSLYPPPQPPPLTAGFIFRFALPLPLCHSSTWGLDFHCRYYGG